MFMKPKLINVSENQPNAANCVNWLQYEHLIFFRNEYYLTFIFFSTIQLKQTNFSSYPYDTVKELRHKHTASSLELADFG